MASQPSSVKRVGVVGSGIAGLVAAYELAALGHQVMLFEQQPRPGGKVHQESVAGQWIDSGPTVMTMRWVFDDLLGQSGHRLDDLMTLRPLDVLARHHWPDGSQLDLFTDLDRSHQAVAEFAGPAEAAAFDQLMAQAREVYHRLEPIYMRGQRPDLIGMTQQLGLSGLALLTRLGPLQSLARHLDRRFRDPRLRQLFARYATYCGGSPWLAPATLMLIAYVESRGVWAIEGGMQSLATGLARGFEEIGGQLLLQTPVTRLRHRSGQIIGLEARVNGQDGQSFDFDAVGFNGDLRALSQAGLLDEPRPTIPRQQTEPSSLSAMTWSAVGEVQGFGLHYHNVFFQPNYAEEFSSIFEQGRLPREPTVYLCAQDRYGDPAGQSDSLGRPERLFLLINAPASQPGQTAPSLQEIDQCQQRVFSRLADAGLKIQLTEPARVKTPADFGRLFPGSRGALYGRAPHGWMSVFHRASSRSPIRHLYLAGGSVHPGAGVPMAGLSGRLAVASLMEDLGLTRKSPQVVISGGMSMA